MEDFIIWIWGFVFGFGIGVLRGRRSIVREAQALVNETIKEYRDWETDRKSTRLNSSH